MCWRQCERKVHVVSRGLLCDYHQGMRKPMKDLTKAASPQAENRTLDHPYMK
jgi:hypothetical protein